MAVWLRRIGIGLAVVVVLLLASVAVALVLVDTAALKRVIADRVEAGTGRELTIEGELDLSVFPWIGFEVGRTRLANAEGFDGRPFVSLERAQLRVRLLPLLWREVTVDRVVLLGLQVNLARNAAGRGNWEDLTAAAREPADTGPAQEPARPSAGPRAPGIALRVEGVEVRAASLRWHDAGSGADLAVRNLDLETGVLAPGVATPLRVSVTLETAGAPPLEVELQTEAEFHPEGPRLRLADLRADLVARSADLPDGAVAVSLRADVDADLAARQVQIDPLALGLAETLEAHGALHADAAGETPAARGNLAISDFSPRALARALGVRLPAGLDPQALQSASAEFGFSANADAARIHDLVLQLDDTRATGSVQARTGDIPEAELVLAVDAIELDRYLPPPAADTRGQAPAGGGAAGAGGDPVASLPLEALRGVRASAAMDVGRLRLRGLDANGVALRARLDDGLLRLERLQAGTAGGSIVLGARLDGRADVPAAGLDLRLTGIESAPLLAALGGTVPVSGRLDAKIALDTAGPTLDDWISALDGNLATTFSDGAIEGINIAQRIRVAWARLQGDPVEDAAAVRRTDFSRLHFAGRVEDGVLRSDTLDLRAPLLRVAGAGSVDLARGQVDYLARIRVTGTLEGQGGAALEDLAGLEIPLRLRGSLADPRIELALADALEARAKAKKAALEREAREAEEKARRELELELEREQAELEQKKRQEKKKLEQKLEDKLKGLFD